MNTLDKTVQYVPTAVDQILVPHNAFQMAKNRIETHLTAAQHYSEPTCIAVIGESRTGKSRLLEYIAKQHPSKRNEHGMYIPVLSIRTPSKPSVKGLVETFLQAIGDPLWHKRGSENEKTERLYTLLKQTKTHTVVIDEFQHFYDKVSHKVQHYLSDWLKIFVDRSGLMLVVAGLPSCMAVINQNEQLRGRFIAPVHMPRFDWDDTNQQGEFIACLGSFQEGLNRFDMPAIDSDEMAFRFYCATGGLIGYLAKILHQACLNVQLKPHGDQRPVITLADLHIAYTEAVWSDRIMPLMSPFSEDFDTSPNRLFIDMAKSIGIASPEVTKARVSRLPMVDLPSAAQVLAA